jgi:hypothetical protein
MSKFAPRPSFAPPGEGDAARRPVSRRAWLGAAAGSAALLLIGQACGTERGGRLDAAQGAAPGDQQGGAGATLASLPTLTMYKDPNCGCCAKWGEHMRGAGFTVNEINSSDMTTVKREQGVPETMYSCHTAIVGAYVIEGHVPADLVKKVLAERPGFRGLSAPGMPQSAPGMDIGSEKYDIHSFTQQGDTALYAVRP